MRIFISAVSSEFRALRADIAKSLRTVDYEVRDQEYFRNQSGTLLELLEAYIDNCDTVIHIAGKRSGAMPQLAEVPKGAPRRSYTQWEYQFARGERLSGQPNLAKRPLVSN